MKKSRNNKIKSRKRKLSLEGLTVLMLVTALMASLGSSLFLRSFNNTLSIEAQKINSEIMSFESQNESLKIEIQTLSSRGRVTNIATDNGLDMNHENITTVMVGE
ncbi:MAG: cell division protein FtsL [Anaerorhabdus sp.]